MAINKYFEDIADAIRERAGTSGSITPAGMPSAILAIPGGGGGGSIFEWDFTQSLTDSIRGNTAVATGCQLTNEGLKFTNAQQYCVFNYTWLPYLTYEIEFGIMDYKPSSIYTMLVTLNAANSDTGLNINPSGHLAYYNGQSGSTIILQENFSFNSLTNSTLKIVNSGVDSVEFYLNGSKLGSVPGVYRNTSTSFPIILGSSRSTSSGGRFYNATVKSLKIY